MNAVLDDLISADWCFTRTGGMFHIAGPKVPGRQRHTHCGRLAYEHADSPLVRNGDRACVVCIRAEVEAG